MAEKAKMKLNYGKTALIGFGFMAVQIAWIIYNAFVPLILADNATISSLAWSGTAIGIIMVLDNIFGVIFQPLFGRISDRTHTRFGNECTLRCWTSIICNKSICHLWCCGRKMCAHSLQEIRILFVASPDCVRRQSLCPSAAQT